MWWLLQPKRRVPICLTACVKTVPVTVPLTVAAQQAADVVVTTLEMAEIVVAVIVALAQANPVKALRVLTTAVVLLHSALHKLDVVVLSAVVAVALVVIKATPATVAAMTSSPATFATTQVAMWLVLAPTIKANAIAPAVNPIHCAPAWTAWPVAAVVVVAIMAVAVLAATVVATVLAAVVLLRVGLVAIRQGRLDVKNR
jgi:hypothetical protein